MKDDRFTVIRRHLDSLRDIEALEALESLQREHAEVRRQGQRLRDLEVVVRDQLRHIKNMEDQLLLSSVLEEPAISDDQGSLL